MKEEKIREQMLKERERRNRLRDLGNTTKRKTEADIEKLLSENMYKQTVTDDVSELRKLEDEYVELKQEHNKVHDETMNEGSRLLFLYFIIPLIVLGFISVILSVIKEMVK